MQKENTFIRTIPILNARTPILKCIHRTTGFSCDINFTNVRGCFNSNILKFLFHEYDTENRMFHLAIILKYWLKLHNLSGTGKITNYCLMSLIIYFLQSIRDPILPPIFEFQKNFPEHIIDHWNFGFNNNIKITTSNKLTILELLQQFFKFYNEFNFNENIICPLIGVPLKKNDFISQKNFYKLPFKKYFEYIKLPVDMNNRKPNELNMNTPMCVQDAFELSHNIASTCGKSNFSFFRSALSAANAIFCENDKKPDTVSNILIKLFTINLEEFEIRNSFSTAFSNAQVCRKFLCKLSCLNLELNKVKELLIANDEPPLIALINRQWANSLVEFILIFFKQYLFLDVIGPLEKDACKIDNKTNKKKIDEPNTEDTYKVIAKINVWGSRDYQHIYGIKAKDFLKNELSYFTKSFKEVKTPTHLNFNVCIQIPSNNSYCEVLFIDNDSNSLDFKSFFDFFIKVIHQYFVAHLIERIAEIKLKRVD